MMHDGLLFAFSALLSISLGLWLTPQVRESARRFGVLDRPNNSLKRQRQPVAYLGGIAVYLTFVITLSLVFEIRNALSGLLLGSTLIVMLGLFDDLKAISPKLKLLGQLLAAWVTLRSGITIELVAVPTLVALPLSVFWIIGISNAFNIIDVSDGLSAGTAGVAAVAFAAIAVLNGDTLLAISALSLGGACFGFLRYNWQPASIYLGDAGSLFVGFFLACTALISSYTEQNVFAAGAPVLILIVPILDTTLVSMARIANGISPMNGSDDHFAIRLKAAGWSAGAVAAMAMGLTALGGIAALGMILSPGSVAAAILISFGGLFLALLLILYFVFPTPSSAAQARDTSLTSGDLAIEPIKRL